jgi:hypothetical protein
MSARANSPKPAFAGFCPHHVALPADKLRGTKNYDIVHSFADTLSAAP